MTDTTTDRLSEITARIPNHKHPWTLEPRIQAAGDEEWLNGWSIWTAIEDGQLLTADVHDEFSPDDEDCDGVSGIVVANIDCKNDVPPDAERIAQFILHAPQDMRWLASEVQRLNGLLADTVPRRGGARLHILTFDGRPLMASRDAQELRDEGVRRAEAFYPPRSSPEWVSGPYHGWDLVLDHLSRAQDPTPLRIVSVDFPDATEGGR